MYNLTGTHSIASYVNRDNRSESHDSTHLDSFGVKYTPKQIKKFIGNKITFRIQADNSIMCGYFSNGLIDFVLKGDSLLDYTNLFSFLTNMKSIMKYY